jgi:hypothetical protein
MSAIGKALKMNQSLRKRIRDNFLLDYRGDWVYFTAYQQSRAAHAGQPIAKIKDRPFAAWPLEIRHYLIVSDGALRGLCIGPIARVERTAYAQVFGESLRGSLIKRSTNDFTDFRPPDSFKRIQHVATTLRDGRAPQRCADQNHLRRMIRVAKGVLHGDVAAERSSENYGALDSKRITELANIIRPSRQ